MKINGLIAVLAISSSAVLFSNAAIAANPNNIAGVYKITVCGGTIIGVASLAPNGAASIIDSNESAIDTTAIGIWNVSDGGVISGKATFYRGGPVGAEVDLFITNGKYDNKTGSITGTLALPTGSCPDLLLVPYTL